MVTVRYVVEIAPRGIVYLKLRELAGVARMDVVVDPTTSATSYGVETPRYVFNPDRDRFEPW